MTTFINRRSLFASGAGLAALTLAACGGGEEEASLAEEGGVTTIRVAATPEPHAQILTFISDNLAADAGIELEIEERSEEHTSELQSRGHLVCRLLLEKKNKKYNTVGGK